MLTNRQPPIKQSHKDSIHFTSESFPSGLCPGRSVVSYRSSKDDGDVPVVKTVRVIRQGTTGGDVSHTSWGRPWSLQPEEEEGEVQTEGGGGKKNKVWLLGEINIVNYYLAFIARVLTSYMQLQIFYMKLLSVFGFLSVSFKTSKLTEMRFGTTKTELLAGIHYPSQLPHCGEQQ